MILVKIPDTIYIYIYIYIYINIDIIIDVYWNINMKLVKIPNN